GAITGAFAAAIGEASNNGPLEQSRNGNPADNPQNQNRPELEAIAKDPVISAAIDKAWADSNPYGAALPDGNTKKIENGFFILRDDKSGALSTVDFLRDGRTNAR